MRAMIRNAMFGLGAALLLLRAGSARAQSGLQYSVVQDTSGNVVGQLTGSGVTVTTLGPTDVLIQGQATTTTAPTGVLGAIVNPDGTYTTVSGTSSSNPPCQNGNLNVAGSLPSNGIYIPVYVNPTTGRTEPAALPPPSPPCFSVPPPNWINANYAQGGLDIAGPRQNPWFVGADGSVFVVGSTDAGIINSKIAAPFKAARITVDFHTPTSPAVPWVVTTTNDIYFYQNGTWTRAGTGKDVGAGADGSIFAIANDAGGSITKWNGTAFAPFPGGGGGAQIAVDPNGYPWVTNVYNQIYQWTGTQWKLLPGGAQDISIGPDGTVYVFGMASCAGGFQLYRWDASAGNWSAEPGACGVSIVAGLGLHATLMRDHTTSMPTIIR